MFQLDTHIDQDTFELGAMELCAVRLMNDARFPWLILVPKRPDIFEILDLNESDRALLWAEINEISGRLQTSTQAYKLNIAALGNMVRQLHIHIIARNQDDAAWPKPVWGVGEAVPYKDAQVAAMRKKLIHM